jgi:hypothetical protein
MTKLMLLLAAAALLVPAAAGAHGRPHHPQPRHHPAPKPAPRSAAKNAAWLCKTMRDHDAAGFAQAYGTGRDAYGKCVSAHGRAHHAPKTLTLHGIAVASSGTVTDAGSPGCQFADAGCTLTSAGTIARSLGGTYSSTWTVLWKQATSNGAGGYCAPATGTTTLVLPALGTLTKSEQGTVCEVGATGTNVEHVLRDGTFSVASGTGAFAGASGHGTVAFDQKPGTSSALGGVVTGSELFADLTLAVGR